MTIAGIIAEYNPFHNGHQLHIEKTRQLTNCDCVCVCMSGNYVQRGLPAILDKFTRAKLALENGADLVVELPVANALSSAQYFANGAITILDNLGIDFLSFGVEHNDDKEMLNLADLLYNNIQLENSIKELVAKGHPYAKAVALAAAECNINGDYIENILGKPNNTLGLEYLKELKNHPNITPVMIRRQGDGYNEASIVTPELASATAIRNAVERDIFAIKDSVPGSVFDEFTAKANISTPIDIDDFTPFLNSCIFTHINNCLSFEDYPAISRDLSNKIINTFTGQDTFSEFIAQLKSKDLSYTRISRGLFQIILNIKDIPEPSYIRVLGFNEKGSKVLRAAKNNSNLPIITKVANYQELLATEITATNIYNSVVYNKFKTKLPSDWTTSPIVVK